jgi:hypothetical protein
MLRGKLPPSGERWLRANGGYGIASGGYGIASGRVFVSGFGIL